MAPPQSRCQPQTAGIVDEGDLRAAPRRWFVVLAFFLLLIANGARATVPDSLLPKGGFRSPPSDPEEGAKLGKYLMIGGAAGIAIGGIVLLTELAAQGEEYLKCEGKGGSSCEDSRSGSGVGKPILITGIAGFGLGILIAAFSRDDSGRDRKYYGSVGPRGMEAGFRRDF